MKRLTNKNGFSRELDMKNELGYSYIYDKLSKYENTGLEPEEISGYFGKFKNAKELCKAYKELEKEFTKKSQELANSIQLPCKIGDEFSYIDYTSSDKIVQHSTVYEITIEKNNTKVYLSVNDRTFFKKEKTHKNKGLIPI